MVQEGEKGVPRKEASEYQSRSREPWGVFTVWQIAGTGQNICWEIGMTRLEAEPRHQVQTPAVLAYSYVKSI